MSRTMKAQMRKAVVVRNIRTIVVTTVGIVFGLPFILGVVFGDLDATTNTYRLVLTIAWDIKLWVPLLVYGVYELYQNRGLFL